jgi:hypothetical protein
MFAGDASGGLGEPLAPLERRGKGGVDPGRVGLGGAGRFGPVDHDDAFAPHRLFLRRLSESPERGAPNILETLGEFAAEHGAARAPQSVGQSG